MRGMFMVVLLLSMSGEAFAQSTISSNKEAQQEALRKEREAQNAILQGGNGLNALAQSLLRVDGSPFQELQPGAPVLPISSDDAPGSPQPAMTSSPAAPGAQVVMVQMAMSGWTNGLLMQAAANMANTGAQPSKPINVPTIDLAALGALEALFSQATNTPENTQQATNAPTLADVQRELREAAAQKILAEAAARAGLVTTPTSPVDVLVETLKGAAKEKKETGASSSRPLASNTQGNAALPPAVADALSPNPQAAISNLVAQQVKEIERVQQQARQNLAHQAAAKMAASTAEKSHSPTLPDIAEPLPVWPAWMGATPLYAAIYDNDAAAESNGFRAFYSGVAQGTVVPVDPNFISVGLVDLLFEMHFEAHADGNVGITGSLLGHDISGAITNRAVNGFTANLDRADSTGELAGKFYGADHGAIGGTFQTNVPGVSNTHGHFAGVAQ